MTTDSKVRILTLQQIKKTSKEKRKIIVYQTYRYFKIKFERVSIIILLMLVTSLQQNFYHVVFSYIKMYCR